MKKAVIVTFDNFTDIDNFLSWDLLNRVKFLHKDFEVKFVGAAASHRSSNGIDLAMHGSLDECRTADLVYFTSGRGARAVIKDQAWLSQLNLDPARQVICSMCSGALVLAALGLLDGVPATTYPSAFEALKEFGVEVLEDKHLVTQGNIGTAAGCLAAVDLMGWAITKLYDERTAQDAIASVLPIGQGQVCLY